MFLSIVLSVLLGNFLTLTQSFQSEYTVSDVFGIWKTESPSEPPEVQGIALDEIANLIRDRPVKVISVVGGYHKGKSSFANAIIGLDKFLVGSDIAPETEGFECVVLTHLNDSKKPAILLFDTPGSGALDFTIDKQAALFGAAYLMSSTVIYNTMREVVTTQDLEILASRLRNVISINATIPAGSDLQLPHGTSDVELMYVVQNIDVNPVTDPEEYIMKFITDFSTRKYDLHAIFPNRIKPYLFPTPLAQSEFLSKFSANNEEMWRHDYKSKVESFRTDIFDHELNKDPRIWPSFAAWKKRLNYAFSESTMQTLMGFNRATEAQTLQFMNDYLLTEARNYGLQSFKAEVKLIAVQTEDLTAKTLARIKETSLDRMTLRAVGVPVRELQASLAALRSELDDRILVELALMRERVNTKWKDCESSVSRYFDTQLREKFAVPFDYRPAATDARLAQLYDDSAAQMEICVGQLSSDTAKTDTCQRGLRELLEKTYDAHLHKNAREIQAITNAYSLRVERDMETLTVTLTEEWCSQCEPVSTFVQDIKGELGKAVLHALSTKGYAVATAQDGTSTDLTRDSGREKTRSADNDGESDSETLNFFFDDTLAEWRNAQLLCNLKLQTLVTKVEDLHTLRVGHFAERQSDRAKQHFYDCRGNSVDKLPADRKDVLAAVKACKETSAVLFAEHIAQYVAMSAAKSSYSTLLLFLQEKIENWEHENNELIQAAATEYSETVASTLKALVEAIASHSSASQKPTADFPTAVSAQIDAAKVKALSPIGLKKTLHRGRSLDFLMKAKEWSSVVSHIETVTATLVAQVEKVHAARVQNFVMSIDPDIKKSLGDSLMALRSTGYWPKEPSFIAQEAKAKSAATMNAFDKELSPFAKLSVVETARKKLQQHVNTTIAAFVHENRQVIDVNGDAFKTAIDGKLVALTNEISAWYAQVDPTPSFMDNSTAQLLNVIVTGYSSTTMEQQGIPVWLKDTDSWKADRNALEKRQLNIVSNELLPLHTERVKTFSNRIKSEQKRILETVMHHTVKVPQQAELVEAELEKFRIDMIRTVNETLLVPFAGKNEPLKQVLVELSACADKQIKKRLAANDKAWSQLVAKPTQAAMASFQFFLEQCNHLNLTDYVFTMECWKVQPCCIAILPCDLRHGILSSACRCLNPTLTLTVNSILPPCSLYNNPIFSYILNPIVTR